MTSRSSSKFQQRLPNHSKFNFQMPLLLDKKSKSNLLFSLRVLGSSTAQFWYVHSTNQCFDNFVCVFDPLLARPIRQFLRVIQSSGVFTTILSICLIKSLHSSKLQFQQSQFSTTAFSFLQKSQHNQSAFSSQVIISLFVSRWGVAKSSVYSYTFFALFPLWIRATICWRWNPMGVSREIFRFCIFHVTMFHFFSFVKRISQKQNYHVI